MIVQRDPQLDLERRTETDADWMSDGSCKDASPDVFFPSDGVGVLAAQRICAGCQVKQRCLEYALANHIAHGVWGGASERQRTRLRRRRALTTFGT